MGTRAAFISDPAGSHHSLSFGCIHKDRRMTPYPCRIHPVFIVYTVLAVSQLPQTCRLCQTRYRAASMSMFCSRSCSIFVNKRHVLLWCRLRFLSTNHVVLKSDKDTRSDDLAWGCLSSSARRVLARCFDDYLARYILTLRCLIKQASWVKIDVVSIKMFEQKDPLLITTYLDILFPRLFFEWIHAHLAYTESYRTYPLMD